MKKFLLMVMMLVVGCASSLRAEIRIDVSGAQSEPLPFAMPDLIGDDGDELTEVVVADLERSGLFRHINPNAYIQKFSSIDTRPNFNDWRAINAQALIYGTVSERFGKMTVAFRIYDVYAGTELYAKYPFSPVTRS